MKKFAYLPMTALLALVVISLHPQAAFAQKEATEADPVHYKVEFENDHIRVVRITYGPGEKSVMHTHAAGIVVCLTGGKTKMTYPDGKSEETECAAGQAMWAPAGAHLPESLNDVPTETLYIEIKEQTTQPEGN